MNKDIGKVIKIIKSSILDDENTRVQPGTGGHEEDKQEVEGRNAGRKK
jgi:hypothetical protein